MPIMQEFEMVTSTGDPYVFYARYRELATRYDQAGVEVDTVRAQLENLDPADKVNHKRLIAHLNKLSNGHSVLLGWVSAYYAAYVFCLHGTETPFITDVDTVNAFNTERTLLPEFWRAAQAGDK